MTPFKISPTKLQTFLDCPRQYYFVYVKGLREPMKPALSVGQVVHNSIDGYFTLRPDLRTPDMIQKVFSTYWQPVSGSRGGFESVVEEQAALAKAMRLIDSFISVTQGSPEPLHHRQTLLTIPVDPELIFQGKVDRVDGLDDGLHLIDYKTGSDDYQNEWQMPMYIAMVEHKYAKPVKQASLWYLDNNKTVPVDPIHHPAGQTIDRVRQIVNQIPRDLDTRSFPCLKGGCQHCEKFL